MEKVGRSMKVGGERKRGKNWFSMMSVYYGCWGNAGATLVMMWISISLNYETTKKTS